MPWRFTPGPFVHRPPYERAPAIFAQRFLFVQKRTNVIRPPSCSNTSSTCFATVKNNKGLSNMIRQRPIKMRVRHAFQPSIKIKNLTLFLSVAFNSSLIASCILAFSSSSSRSWPYSRCSHRLVPSPDLNPVAHENLSNTK